MRYYTCRHVLNEKAPIRIISHEAPEPGVYDHESWTAICGQDQDAPIDGCVLDEACFWGLDLPPEARALGLDRALVRYDPGHRWTERGAYDQAPIVAAPIVAPSVLPSPLNQPL